MKSKKELGGIICALSANIIFGFSFIFSKTALKTADPLVILSTRFLIAFIIFNLLLLTGKFKISLKGKPKGRLFLMGTAQPLLYFIFELYGLSMVSSALSGVIIALVPVAVMLLASIFLKESPSKMQFVCTLLSIICVSAISIVDNDGSKNHILGVLLLLAAVICAAVFNILSRSEANMFSPFERTYVMMIIGCVGFNLIALIKLKGEYFSQITSAFTYPEFIVSILYLSALSSVAAFLLYNYSTSKVSVIQTASFSNIITVVTVFAGVLILKESFSALQYLLCALIILGVWGVNVFTPKSE